MTDDTYSLREVVADGLLTGPRWILHAVKIAQHTAPAFGLWCLTGNPLLSALIAGPGLYALIILHKLWTRAPRNLWDWAHDFALSVVPIGGAFIAVGEILLGCGVLTSCAFTWLVLHEKAIP